MSEHPQTLRARYAAVVAMNLRAEADDLARVVGLQREQTDAHFLARAAEAEWQPADFEQFAALPPGRFDARVLQQTTWWVDILREPHRISDPSDLTDDYLVAVIGFVRENASRWVDVDTFAWVEALAAGTLHDLSADWAERTPLMKALRAEIEKRGLRT